MAIKLQKGGRFNLAKEAPKLTIAGVGLGWDPNEEEGGPNFDLDVSAFLLGKNGKIPAEEYFVFYGSELKQEYPDGVRPYSFDGSLLGAVDAIDGSESDGEDDEDMRIYFDKVSPEIHEILITVSITKYPNDKYRDKRTSTLNFGMIKDCFIRVWDDNIGTEIFRYNIKEKFFAEDALEFGKFCRVANSWEFVATGTGYTGSLKKLVDMYT